MHNGPGPKMEQETDEDSSPTKKLADRCYRTQGRNGELIGTAFVVRDMMQIVDALGGNKMLNYWGKQSAHCGSLYLVLTVL